MVKLTADLILGAAQFTNPIRERELDLRGNGIIFKKKSSAATLTLL